MPNDLRQLLKDKELHSNSLSKGHRKKFEQKLFAELHPEKKKKNTQWMSIAASFALVIGLSASLFFFNNPAEEQPNQATQIENLGSISPDLGKIENFYLASIQSEISSLDQTPENAELVNGYLQKIAELSEDYQALTEELNSEGVNQATVNALIDNLQQRLNLLYQLKEQLDEFKNLQSNETTSIQA